MKETFDNITMNSERQSEMRSMLLTRKKAKKVWLAPALGLVAALAIVMIIPSTRAVVVNAAEKLAEVFHFSRNGLTITGSETSGTDEDGAEIKGVRFSIEMGEGFEPFAQVKDGRLYFVLDGKWKDVTDLCSEKDYYRYEEKAADGTRTVIYVGGTPKDYGWCVTIFDKDSNCTSANFSTSDNGNREWLKKIVADSPDIQIDIVK